jgi:glutamate-1-semialdehyde aminotransferase
LDCLVKLFQGIIKDVKSTGQDLYKKAVKLIPGGVQLLSKRPELLLPDQWPSYYSKAKGVDVWDLDGIKYQDMISGGIGACILGYADPDVDQAVHEAIKAGTMSHLNCPEEEELAELLCELHPWASKVRYARCGGEAMSVAVRIARAHTRRDKVAFCGYHGWGDWYLAANLGDGDVLDGHLLPGLEPAGVPRGLAGTSMPFRYNHIEDLEAIVSKNQNELAAVVMEPVRSYLPENGFLEAVQEIAHRAGAVLIFDEVTSGWRMNTGGVHLTLGVNPDIAVFAKAMSNGYPMAAIVGTADVMEAAQTTFISSTYWTDRIGPTAALATIKKHKALDVPKRLREVGQIMRTGWNDGAKEAGVSITVTGIPALTYFSFNYPNAQAIRTLFTQELLHRGYLGTNAFYPTYAHEPEIVRTYIKTVAEVFALIADALSNEDVEQNLQGPIAHAGFHRLT